MNTCLIHMQSYPLGTHCPYCGPPQTVTIGTVPPHVHDWVFDTAGMHCTMCGYHRPASENVVVTS